MIPSYRAAAAVLVGAALAGCGSGSAGSTGPAVTGSITVMADTSLTGAFDEAGAAFGKAHPEAHVTFAFADSPALATRLAQGEPADVFASAGAASMDVVTRAALNGAAPIIFASDSAAIVVGKGNPKGVTGVADLTTPGLKVVLCSEPAPCGTNANQVLAKAFVNVNPASLEPSVAGVVAKVASGEGDAGIVSASDLPAAGTKVQEVPIPANLDIVTVYPIASTKTSKNAAVDAAFIAFLTGPQGEAILSKHGFGRP